MSTTVLTKAPSIAELRQLVDETDRITTRITVPSHYISVRNPAYFSVEDDQARTEEFNDLISSKITGDPTGLSDIGWAALSIEGSTVVLEVSTIVEFDVLVESTGSDA